jgi:UrcA family protein
VLTAGHAVAQQVVTHSITVAYGDLDPAQEAGARALLHRLETAAQQACGVAPDIRELVERSDYDSCVDTAIATAVVTLHFPLVSALYGNRGEPSFGPGMIAGK